MTDREHADALLEHVAVLAFLYYPGIQVDDPTYRLAEDIEWCVARLGDVSDTERERMRCAHRASDHRPHSDARGTVHGAR